MSIEYTTPHDQIQKLVSQNLTIEDVPRAKYLLQLCGYSNLIKSYREPYIVTDNSGKKVYRNETTFEQIYSLYKLDKALRNSVMAAMLDLEEHLKESAADVVAQSFGTNHSQYLDFSNYRDRRTSQSRFSLSSVLSKIRSNVSSNKDPIHHHMTKYGTVPPWILFKSVYFATIVNFITKFKPAEHENMALHLYDSEGLKLSADKLRMLMNDTMFICLDYRNRAAHGGRMYNFQSNSTLRANQIFDKSIPINGFGQLLFILSLLNYKASYEQLDSTLSDEVNRHCNLYPQDQTFLGQILNINIIQENAECLMQSTFR